MNSISQNKSWWLEVATILILIRTFSANCHLIISGCGHSSKYGKLECWRAAQTYAVMSIGIKSSQLLLPTWSQKKRSLSLREVAFLVSLDASIQMKWTTNTMTPTTTISNIHTIPHGVYGEQRFYSKPWTEAAHISRFGDRITIYQRSKDQLMVKLVIRAQKVQQLRARTSK